MRKLILASASPRRKELLEQIGAVFEIIPAKGEEIITKEVPEEVVKELALQKAREVADAVMVQEGTEGTAYGKQDEMSGLHGEDEIIVLGADTVVVHEGKILGKPKDREDAIRMLTNLSGNTHSVYTGVAMICKDKEKEQVLNFYEETKVTMYPMSAAEIEAYVNSGEPMDKAGAYGIQGKCAIHIEKIVGDYNNVVGLPVARIYQEMSQIGIEICRIS